MQNSNKQKIYKKYETIRFRKDCTLSYNELSQKFNYKPHCTDLLPIDNTSIPIGFSYNNIVIIINDIINYSEFRLISVSEDEKSVCYHFLKG